jgi:hypothetical protein
MDPHRTSPCLLLRVEARQWESRDAVTIRDLLLCLRRARVDQLLIVDCRRQQPIDVLSRYELHRLAVSPDGEVGRIEDVLGSGRVSANPDLAVQALANTGSDLRAVLVVYPTWGTGPGPTRTIPGRRRLKSWLDRSRVLPRTEDE